MKNRIVHIFVVVLTILFVCVSIAFPPSSSVLAAGTPPTAIGRSYTINENSSLRSKLRATDPDSGQLTYSVVDNPLHGKVNVTNSRNGNFTYTPDTFWEGSDSFTFTASDGQNVSAKATINIIIRVVNYAPVAVNDGINPPYSTNEDVTLNVSAADGVLKNDSDPNGNPITAVLATGPAHGKLYLNAINSDGSFSYTPDPHWYGTDTFTYHARDSKSSSNLATVTITVNSVNFPPIAIDNIYQIGTSNPLIVPAASGVLSNDSDPDDVPGVPVTHLTAVVVSYPTKGTLTQFNSDGSFTYTPGQSYDGIDSFTYRAYDGSLYSSEPPALPATVTIVGTLVNHAPVAQDLNLSTAEDTSLSGSLVATDQDSNPLSFFITSWPTNGTLNFSSDGSFTYAPDANWNGLDSFTYKANDDIVFSNVATVHIAVSAVNDPPVAADQEASVNEDQTLFGTVHATDVDGDTLTYSVVAPPDHGQLTLNSTSGNFTYTPDLNWDSPDSFSFKANDGHVDSAPGTVSITVNPVNDAPVAVNGSASTVINTLVQGTLVASDVDNYVLTFSVVHNPSHGNVVITDTEEGTFTYTPDPNWLGNDSFTFRAYDGVMYSNTATVNLVVADNPKIYLPLMFR